MVINIDGSMESNRFFSRAPLPLCLSSRYFIKVGINWSLSFWFARKTFFFWFRVRHQGPHWHLSIGETWRPGNSPNWVVGIGLLPGVAIARPGPPVWGGGPRWRLMPMEFPTPKAYEKIRIPACETLSRSGQVTHTWSYFPYFESIFSIDQRTRHAETRRKLFMKGWTPSQTALRLRFRLLRCTYIFLYHIAINIYIYIFTDIFYINIIFLHIRAYNHIHIYIHCITSHYITYINKRTIIHT